MNLDVERISALLTIAKECTGHSGKLSSLQGAAIGELMEINAAIKAEAVAAAEAEKSAAAEPELPIEPTDESADLPATPRRL